jgi:rSAM/selenodomain-associated transferase 2
LNAPALSIVMPVLNEAGHLDATLRALAPLQQRGVEVIVVDGGSDDDTVEVAKRQGILVCVSPRGRARQMNTGAALARGDMLLFLHADTQLPPDADRLVAQAIARGAVWGRFDVTIPGQSALLPVVAALMNIRSRWTGIATGDQALFVKREIFQRLGGFPDQPLMEDIELSRRLCRLSRPACLRAKVTTSGRRWDTRGAWSTIFLMWRLRWRYWRGESAERLAELYR